MKNPLIRNIRLFASVTGCLLLAAHVGARPDSYTSGFYTRGSDEASYIDQGGVIDPLYISRKNWALIPRLTFEVQRDSNYYMNSQNEKVSTSMNLYPGAMLIYGRPDHNHLYADAELGLPLHHSMSAQEDGLSYVLRTGGAYKTGKTRILGRIGHRRNEYSDTLAASRVLNRNVVGNLSLEHRVSLKSSLGMNGQMEFHDFDSEDYLNYRRYYVAGRFFRRMTAKSEWFIQTGAGRDLLDKSSKGLYGNALFYDLSVGMRGKPSPKTSVSGRVGYRLRRYDDSSISEVRSWIADIGAEATPFGLSTFSADLIADIRPDITATGDSAVDHRLTLGVTRRLFTERLRGNASVQYGTVDYYGTGNRLDDDYWGYNLGLDWWTRRHLSFGLLYSYVEREGSESTAYDSSQVTFRMSWNY